MLETTQPVHSAGDPRDRAGTSPKLVGKQLETQLRWPDLDDMLLFFLVAVSVLQHFPCGKRQVNFLEASRSGQLDMAHVSNLHEIFPSKKLHDKVAACYT